MTTPNTITINNMKYAIEDSIPGLIFRKEIAMNDHELLKLAAKAAGYDFPPGCKPDEDALFAQIFKVWSPLTNDGDALRLAVKLLVNVYADSSVVVAEICSDYEGPNICVKERVSGDPYAATRRAIVRAAAEIGKEES